MQDCAAGPGITVIPLASSCSKCLERDVSGGWCGQGPLDSGACLLTPPPGIAHALHSPLQLGTRLSQPRQELLHLTWWPRLRCTWLSQLGRRKTRRGGGSQGRVKGWARLGGGGGCVFAQDRTGLAFRGMKSGVPLQLHKMKGCQSITKAG